MEALTALNARIRKMVHPHFGEIRIRAAQPGARSLWRALWRDRTPWAENGCIRRLEAPLRQSLKISAVWQPTLGRFDSGPLR